MKCEEARLLLHAWIDRELDPANSRLFDQHIAKCPECKAEADKFVSLSHAIKSEATRHEAPSELRSCVAKAIRQSQGGAVPNTMMPLKWSGFGAAVSLAACLAFLLVVRPDEQYVLQQELLSSHIRSLQDGHLTDVVSTDQHTVKPWFNGRLDISPPVTDLATDGFPLIGGRLDYVDGHPAAVLVYQYNKHIINLFIWHEEPGSFVLNQESTIQGYNMLHWQHDGLQFWAVSDVNSSKLGEFEQTYAAHAP
jgi:anti-sigma factor (TIGR02949 family)